MLLQLPPFGRGFQRENCTQHVARSGARVRGSGFVPIERSHTTSNTSQCKVLLYLHSTAWTEFQCQKSYCTPIRPLVWGRVGWTLGVKYGTNQNVDPTFLYIIWAYLAQNVADRVIRIGRLCLLHPLLPAHTD